MQREQGSPGGIVKDVSGAAGRTAASRWRRGMSTSIVVLVLVQAALAGQFLYESAGLVGIHRVVAELVPLVSVVLVVVTWLQIKDGVAVPRTDLGVSVAVLVLIVVQTGLGFAGRNKPGAAAVHIPLGVLIFGLATQNAVAIWASAREARESRGDISDRDAASVADHPRVGESSP